MQQLGSEGMVYDFDVSYFTNVIKQQFSTNEKSVTIN